MLADAAGVMPDSLKLAADQRFFEAGLDRADVAVHGRHSHEHQPNSPRRWRLTLTHSVDAIAPDPGNRRARFWNPAGCSLESAIAALGVRDAAVAVIGGTIVFGLFLDRYDTFFLTRAPNVRLPGGRAVFPGVPLKTPEAVMTEHGMQCVRRQILDASAHLAVEHWGRERLAE